MREFLRSRTSSQPAASVHDVAVDLLGAALTGLIDRGRRSVTGTTALWLGDWRF
jgi:protease-4